MKAEHVNPFMKAAYSVLEMVLGEPPQRQSMQATTSGVAQGHPYNFVLGITGQIHGSVILGLSEESATAIASTMLGQPVPPNDPMTASAIAELGNMICGHGLQNLLEAGFQCDLTPPTLVRDASKISTLALPALTVPLELPQGPIFLTIGVRAK